MEKISVVGLGKLGLCFAACTAAKGFKTIGVDISGDVVRSVNQGLSPIIEPGLQGLICESRGRLTATQNHQDAIEKTDVTFIMVGTPSDPTGIFSNQYVKKALVSLAEALGRSNKEYHLFVISSTVMPTSTEENFIPIIEKYSGKRVNKDFGVCYVPDFVALGSVIRDFLNPDFVLVGESNKSSGEQLVPIYKRLCENKPPIFRMSIISAEIVKVSLNCYITLKISFANTLANLCERIPGADIDVITRVLGADKRISPHYLRGGLAYGGTCFPRDTRAFILFGRKYEYEMGLIKAVEEINRFQDGHLTEKVLACVSSMDDGTVSILGLSFKPNTPVITESPAIKLIDKLLDKKIRIIVYDPLAMEDVKAVFGNKISYANSVRDCILQSPVCVITTQADEFKSIDESYILHNPTTIIDCWRILDPKKLGKKVKYIALGRAQR